MIIVNSKLNVLLNLKSKSVASFPDSYALECEHWSCAGGKSLVSFLTWAPSCKFSGVSFKGGTCSLKWCSLENFCMHAFLAQLIHKLEDFFRDLESCFCEADGIFQSSRRVTRLPRSGMWTLKVGRAWYLFSREHHHMFTFWSSEVWERGYNFSALGKYV